MMSSGSGMDMSSMMGGSGGAYDVTAYVTMPEGPPAPRQARPSRSCAPTCPVR